MKIRLRNLNISFGDKTIIQNSNIDFSSGTVSLIQSPSGTGKTSIINLIGLMKTGESLDYQIDDKQMSKLSQYELADFRLKHIGFVFQDNNLVQDITVIDNILVPALLLKTKEEAISQARTLINFLGLSEIENSLVKTISGGEAQRVAMARALINDPEIIIADEPTSSLDRINAENILGKFRELAQKFGKIIIIVSHDERALKFADVLYTIKDQQVKLLSHPYHNRTERNNDVISFSPFKRTGIKAALFYNKIFKKNKRINRVFVALGMIFVSLLMIFWNFGTSYIKNQERFINSMTSKNITLINNTLGIGNVTTSTDGDLSFTSEEMSNINKVKNVEKAFPYYYFYSNGFTVDGDTKNASLKIDDGTKVIYSKTYSNNFTKSNGQSIENSLVVDAFYPEEDSFFNTSSSTGNTFYITSDFAKSTGAKVGQHLSLNIYVPIALYKSNSTFSNGIEKPSEGYIYAYVPIVGTISGIINESSDPTKGRSVASTLQESSRILLPYSAFNAIMQNAIKNSSLPQSVNGFKTQPLAPNTLTIYGRTVESLPAISNTLKEISKDFSVNSPYINYQSIKNNTNSIRNIMVLIMTVMGMIVSVSFSFIFMLKNSKRSKEVGTLKAIGFTGKNIASIFSIELLYMALKMFIGTLILSVILSYSGNIFLGQELFEVDLSSIVFGLMIIILFIGIAGVLPTIITSRLDPVDAIRNSNN